MIHIKPLFLQLKERFHKRKTVLALLPPKLRFLILLLAISIFLIPLESMLVYSYVFRGQVFPNIFVLNIPLGGKTVLEATTQLQATIKPNFPTIVLQYEQSVWQIDPRSVGVRYNVSDTVRDAYATGRNQAWWENFIKRWQLLSNKHTVPLAVTFNQEKWQMSIATISSQINQPAISPSITIAGLGQNRVVTVNNGQPGQQINETLLTQELKKQLVNLENQPIAITITPILPSVSPEQAEAMRQRAEQLLNKSLTLSTKEQSWTLKDEEVITFLDFTNDLDREKIASWTAQLAEAVNRPAQNALFRFENGRVIEFKPALDGFKLQEDQAVNEIMNGIYTLEKDSEENLTINLPLIVEKPIITTAEVNNLGIQELIGKGESWFRGSIASRIHNIRLASQKFNGILIAPGETLSFNQTVGEVDKSTGYQQAYIIKEGRTVLGDGGGVCQVSTTLFRAALNAGLPIIERHAHAYRVSYYEQNSQIGQDATVFSPSVDLKISNDTPGHILVQTRVDGTIAKLTFELYGTSDGRQVLISQSRIWDQVSPPPDLYQDDPSLPVGVVKQVDWKAWGAKASFDWKVIRNQQVIQERTFYSAYRPWQSIFLRGTGGI